MGEKREWAGKGSGRETAAAAGSGKLLVVVAGRGREGAGARWGLLGVSDIGEVGGCGKRVWVG